MTLQTLLDAFTSADPSAMGKVTLKMGVRLCIDIISVFLLVRFVYVPVYKKRDLSFTFFIFNVIIFFICFLLNKVDLSMGAAFGLFAVFSMLRYRTEDIEIKDMTYLFIVIAMGLIAAIAKLKDVADGWEYLFIGGINLVLLSIAWVLESNTIIKRENSKTVIYEKIELIKPEKEAELILDLRNRTGLNVHSVQIISFDFMRDTALIKILYY